LDRLGPELTEAGQGRIQNRFQRLVELEVAFFDQAYG
jgi:thiaminase